MKQQFTLGASTIPGEFIIPRLLNMVAEVGTTEAVIQAAREARASPLFRKRQRERPLSLAQ